MKWNTPKPLVISPIPYTEAVEVVPSEFDPAFADFNLPLLDQEVLVIPAEWRKPMPPSVTKWPRKKK